jgi:hypothetical protein
MVPKTCQTTVRFTHHLHNQVSIYAKMRGTSQNQAMIDLLTGALLTVRGHGVDVTLLDFPDPTPLLTAEEWRTMEFNTAGTR